MQEATSIPPATEPSPFEGDPMPLVPKVIVRPFPYEQFPPAVANMISAVAEATQTDAGMAGTTALTVLAAAAGGRVELEARTGWREPLCLYCATVAGPGERKSAVQAQMTMPLTAIEEDLAAEGAIRRTEAETIHAIATKDAEKVQRSAVAATGAEKDKLQAEAISAAAFAESLSVPAIPRILADDITPEAAGSILADQGGRLAVISAEGGIFDVLGGRYSNQVPNLDLWLKGHSGDPVRIDRKGRSAEYIKRPALTLGLMLQPSVLHKIGRNDAFRGRGLLARFLYAEPVSKVGRRKVGADPVPDDVQQAYNDTVSSLVRGLDGWSGDPAILQLDPKARDAIIKIEGATEPELGPGGVLHSLADWGSKYVGAVLRIAGLLHLAQHGADAAIRTPVAIETILSAVRIGTYYKTHAIKAFSTMQTDQDTADAIYLLDRIGTHAEKTISARDLHHLTQARFKTRADLEPPLNRLLEAGWLAPVPAPEHTGPGRPPAPKYAIHPRAREVHTEPTEPTQPLQSVDSVGSINSVGTS